MTVASPRLPVSPHADVIASLAAADPECHLEHGVARLSQGGDLPLLLAVCHAMIRCDLTAVAEALLHATAPNVQTQPAVQQLRSQLARLPSNQIPHEELSQQHRVNADALASRYAGMDVLFQAGPPSAMRFIRSRAGIVHVLRTDVKAGFRTVFPFVHHAAQAAAMKLPASTLQTSYGLIGVPSVPMLLRLWNEHVNGYRPAIDIIETDEQVLNAWLCMVPDSSMLADRRLNLVVGERALGHYADWLVDHPSRMPPSIVLTNHRMGWTPPRIDDAWRTGVETRAAARRARIKQHLEQTLRQRSESEWSLRFQQALRGEVSLKIVGFTNRYSTVVQHAMRHLAAAFERLGHSLEVVSQPDECSPIVDVAGAIEAGDHDMMVAINHLRFEYADVMPANLPYVGWIQDHVDHLWQREAGVSIGKHDLVIAHAPDVLAGLYGYPRERLLASSNLTDVHMYSSEPLPADELDACRCDLSFVSHGASTPEQLCDEIESATTPAFGRMMRSFLALARSRMEGADGGGQGCLNAQQLVEVMIEAEQDSGHPPLSPAVRRAHVYPQVARIHDRMFRHQTLAWAAAWAEQTGRLLRIYGRGWSEHPTLSPYAAGEVASGRSLRAVYQASKINLQANAYASLHQRLLDGVASGALVISRFNPADFVRQPFKVVCEWIRAHNVKSLQELLNEAGSDATLAKAITEAERLSGAVIAPTTDPRRAAHAAACRLANDIPELQTDDGLFRMLRDMRFIPSRVASDLPGFDTTVFRNQHEMHDMLNRMIADQSLRTATAMRMREQVMRHDTYDALAKKIIAAFAEGMGASCGG